MDVLVVDVIDSMANKCAEVQYLGILAVQQCLEIVTLARVLIVKQLEHLRMM